MKNPTIKVIKSWLNKIKYSDFKKFLNQKIIFFVAPLILTLIIVIYFFRPVFFNYSDKYILLQDNIYNSFKLKTNFEDKVSYKVFPSPRIVISNLTFNFDKDKINVNEIAILISPLKLQNIDSFEFKKILILNQNIKVYPSNLDKLFKFFSQKKKSESNIKKFPNNFY